MNTFGKIGLFIVLMTMALGCDTQNTSKIVLEDFIPENPVMVLSVSDFEILRKDLQQNVAFSSYSENELQKLLSGHHPLLKYLKPTSRSLISLHKRDSSGIDFTLVTKQDSALFVTDSIRNIISETYTSGDLAIDRVQIDEFTAFTAVRDSFFLMSSSQQLLQESLSDTQTDHSFLHKSLQLGEDAELLMVRSNGLIRLSDSLSEVLSDRLTLDLTISPSGIRASGVAMNTDTIPRLIDVFKGQIPQSNTIAGVHPLDAEASLTFTFNNPDSLVKKLKDFRADFSELVIDPMFETITEICDLKFKNGNAIVMHSIDAALTNEAILSKLTENTTFRDVQIFDFGNPALFINHFAPLINRSKPVLAFRLDQFFVFTESMSTAESIITNFKSNNVLLNSTYYKNSARDLGTASSLLVMNFGEEVSGAIADILFGDMKSKASSGSLKNYQLSAFQLSYDRNFAHLNFVSLETSETRQIAGGVTQVFSKRLETDILGTPHFFSNHRTGGKDIVVQDMSNKLHLLSSNGKILWSKQLENRILGEIHEVDILRNGKKQLAFTTKNRLHLIDRNGNTVQPFPVKFKDDITQALSVFDYDNNRKYRFAIVQDRDVLLYDNKGKLVSGFKFKGAESTIVLPAQHLRMGNKDYILIAEEKGTLHILSRVGTSRVSVNERFKFSNIPIAEEASNFVVITAEKTKERISQSGKVSSQKLNVSDSYSFSIDYNTKVTLDDNLLRIDGKLVELPFGIYTEPGLFREKGETHISITETQENKVYLYNSSGELLPGFPVYGTSSAELVAINRARSLRLLVMGESNEIILYELQ